MTLFWASCSELVLAQVLGEFRRHRPAGIELGLAVEEHPSLPELGLALARSVEIALDFELRATLLHVDIVEPAIGLEQGLVAQAFD